MDTFLYNGDIERLSDLECIRTIAQNQSSDKCNLLLITPGGDPDAAFKIARYIQRQYDHFQLTVPGLCKSAGTLLAMGAHELVFAPYGELGPLDIQMSKVDQVTGLESGLNTSEAFKSLELRARQTYTSIVGDILRQSGGVVSFQTASHAAVEAVSALYGPIFARIDPEEVGSRSRAMRIGEDYGKRLNLLSGNLKDGALRLLAQSYSSHGFVIDYIEACSLFNNVREATAAEIASIEELGDLARLPQGGGMWFDRVEWPSDAANEDKETDHGLRDARAGEARANPGGDEQDFEGAVGGERS